MDETNYRNELIYISIYMEVKKNLLTQENNYHCSFDV